MVRSNSNRSDSRDESGISECFSPSSSGFTRQGSYSKVTCITSMRNSYVMKAYQGLWMALLQTARRWGQVTMDQGGAQMRTVMEEVDLEAGCGLS